MVDVLIVGQGLAGTLLSFFLKKKGITTLVIDDDHQTSSSLVAAGLVNPVTGRKYNKSWMIDDLLPFATKTYRELEKLLDIKIVTERNIVRTLPDIRSENNWHSKFGDPEYESYHEENPSLGLYSDMIHPPFSFGEIKRSMQVDLTRLIESFRKEFENEFIIKPFDFEKLHISESEKTISYTNVSAKSIVFCDGYRGAYNPLFSYLPFEGAKGEVLIVKIPGFDAKKILKHQLFLAPMGDDRYWVGSGYAWDLSNVEPTNKEKERLTAILKKILKVPFEVENHIAGVRPSINDRRPLLGSHPAYNNVYLFNGLGTKGSSLGPYWADKMVNFIVDGYPLPDEVNIERYEFLKS